MILEKVQIGKRIWVFVVFLMFVELQAQQPMSWQVLAQVIYKPYQDKGMGVGMEKPIPGPVVTRFNGKEIKIKGYVIPMDIDGHSYMLSAQPNSTCFFCGKAGMETVIELWMKDKSHRFKMDQVVTFTGTLLLNKDVYGLMYILEDAEPVPE